MELVQISEINHLRTLDVFSVPTDVINLCGKFEFKNPAIVEGKQYKQTKQFSVMAKGSDYFLSLDDKPKQRYKVKINNI